MQTPLIAAIVGFHMSNDSANGKMFWRWSGITAMGSGSPAAFASSRSARSLRSCPLPKPRPWPVMMSTRAGSSLAKSQ